MVRIMLSFAALVLNDVFLVKHLSDLAREIDFHVLCPQHALFLVAHCTRQLLSAQLNLFDRNQAANELVDALLPALQILVVGLVVEEALHISNRFLCLLRGDRDFVRLLELSLSDVQFVGHDASSFEVVFKLGIFGEEFAYVGRLHI